MDYLFGFRIAKTDSRRKCIICDDIIKKGERRALLFNWQYMPLHYGCLIYIIAKQFLPEMKRMNMKNFEKRLIVRKI